MTITIDSSILEPFLPQGILEWFDIVKCESINENVLFVFEEKNIPPLQSKHENKNIVSKGFFDITITDFPIRGKRSLMTFRRRRWKVEGELTLLKRDIKLTAEGTQLEKEFASFLKEDGGRESGLAYFYRRVSKDPGERI